MLTGLLVALLSFVLLVVFPVVAAVASAPRAKKRHLRLVRPCPPHTWAPLQDRAAYRCDDCGTVVSHHARGMLSKADE